MGFSAATLCEKCKILHYNACAEVGKVESSHLHYNAEVSQCKDPHKNLQNPHKNMHESPQNWQYYAYIMHTYAKFCILMQNSASKSANLCKIPHYNLHAEVSMFRSSHYKGMRTLRRVRIIYLREIQNWIRTHLIQRENTSCIYWAPFSSWSYLLRSTCIISLLIQWGPEYQTLEV